MSRAQLHDLGVTEKAIRHRVAAGRLTIVEQGVLALAPVLDDDWGRWMGAALTAPHTILSHVSATAAWGCWSRPRKFETVTRAGSGGPRRHGGIVVFRHRNVDDVTTLKGIPVTTPERTLVDIAPGLTDAGLARCVREAVRLEHTSVDELSTYLARNSRRRGSRRLAATVARYAGLPLERARSGAEIRALEILRAAGVVLPRLNTRIAGEEADLSWPRQHLIVEIDGGPFHLDVGEDARKRARWEAAGWTVRRLSSDAVYEQPHQLLALAPAANVPR